MQHASEANILNMNPLGLAKQMRGVSQMSSRPLVISTRHSDIDVSEVLPIVMDARQNRHCPSM